MKYNIRETYIKPIGMVLLSALILCFWAFYNKYPLFFNSDSAMYLDAAFYRSVGPDRPIIYGLWMYFLSFQWSLWPVVVIQSIVVAWLLYCWFYYFKVGNNCILYFVFILFITFFTGASFETSWLMPDVFIGITILSIGLLVFVNKIRHVDYILVSILAVLGIIMHNSHFFIYLGLILIFLFGFLIKTIRNEYQTAGIKLYRILYVLLLISCSYFASSLINYNYGGHFKNSNGGAIFFMGNLVEMGIVDTYLAENCETKNYNICQYSDTLPNNFIWAINSPIHKNGGWEGNREEYTAITKDIITTPKYVKTVIFKSVLNTLKQFFHFDTGEAGKATPRSDNIFGTFYPQEYNHFLNSRQNREKLHFGFTNFAQKLVFACCIFCYLFIILTKKMTGKYRLIILFILLGLVLNAWVCGTFSGVFYRYQARLTWLLPLPLFLYFMKWGKGILKTNISPFNSNNRKNET